MKKYLFPVDALVLWCPTWSKNLGRNLCSSPYSKDQVSQEQAVVHSRPPVVWEFAIATAACLRSLKWLLGRLKRMLFWWRVLVPLLEWRNLLRRHEILFFCLFVFRIIFFQFHWNIALTLFPLGFVTVIEISLPRGKRVKSYLNTT